MFTKQVMRNALVPVLAVLALGAGGIAIQKHLEASAYQDRLTTLERELRAAEENLKAAQADVGRLQGLEENNRRLAKERDDARARAKEGSEGNSSSAAGGSAGRDAARAGDFRNIMQGFAKQMDDPEFRKAMQGNQQRMINGAYEALFKKLELSEEDSKLVADLLSSRNMAAMDLGRKIMNGQTDDATMTEVRKQIESTKADYDTKLKGMLGESKFSELSTYEQTLGDQRALDSAARSFQRKNIPLEPTQREALTTIMREERLKLPNNEIPDIGGGPGMSVLLSDTEAKAREQQEQTYQDTVLNRASQAGLSPDQVNALRESFTERNQRRTMGRVMGRAFLGGGAR